MWPAYSTLKLIFLVASNPTTSCDMPPNRRPAAAVQDAGYSVATQGGGPQQVQTIAFSTETETDWTATAPITTTAAFFSQTTDTTTLGETSTASKALQRTGFYYTWTSTDSQSASSPTLLASSIAQSSSLVPSSSMIGSGSSASFSTSSLSLVASTSTASSASSNSPPTLLSSPTSSPSPSNSIAPQTMTHGAPFYASITLGVLIIFASIVAVVTFCIRIRHQRRNKLNPIVWDPVTIDPSEPKPPFAFASDFTLAGDRDVGEPKRASSTLNRRASIPWEATNPFEEHSYYSPHQIVPLPDSAAYPLPPVAPHSDGPYPIPRPLPTYLGAGPSHTPSLSRSRISSRTGSIRSNLPSPNTLCVANAAPGMAVPQLRSDAEFDYLETVPVNPPEHRMSAPDIGTPRETETRPRFMSLPGGRGLDVPWKGAVAADQIHREDSGRVQEMNEGWTQTLRTSVLNAFQAVTGVGSSEDEEDNLTHAPSMVGRERRQSVSRERRESGWARFAAEEMTLDRTESYSTVDSQFLAPPRATALQIQPSGTSFASDGNNSVQTDNSQAPLITKPRTVMLSRESSVYSTASGMPPVSAYTLSYLRG
ncbi:hypothetical protein C8F01DRAFT_1162385 [Mycena amicta]|nr:hypothetical protein C8F01DRAFT_1162385 [Mycena amicta]